MPITEAVSNVAPASADIPNAGHDLVVLSGGLDSTTVLAGVVASAKEAYPQRWVSTISFDYNQRHKYAELEAAENIARHYSVPHVVRSVLLGKGGVLMDTAEQMPHATYEELQKAEGPSPTYVPYRNGTFLSLATSYALEIQADTVWIGVHADDAHNFAYPDCTPEFIGAMQNAIHIGTYYKVRLVAPLQYMTKQKIVERGWDLAVPFALTHSCYEGSRPACGLCPTCVSRLEAFRAAHIHDPLDYRGDANDT
jgi:7-cyano-7-deazaguanine synthase